MAPGLLALTFEARSMMTKKKQPVFTQESMRKKALQDGLCSISIQNHAQNLMVQIEGRQWSFDSVSSQLCTSTLYTRSVEFCKDHD